MAPIPEQLLSNISLSTETNTNRSSVLTNSIQSYSIYDDVDLCNSKLYTDINDSHLLNNNNRSSFHSKDDDDDSKDSSHDNNSQTPLEQFDLRQDYENAIDCLVNCESLISTLQQRLKVKDEKLQLKDEHISNLEETIIKMSLQLANLKASEDETKLAKRRSSMNDMSDMISLSKDDFGLNDDDPLSKSLVIRAVGNDRLIKAVQKESNKKKKKQQQEEFERSTSSLPETLSTKVGLRRGLSMPDDGNYARSAQSLGYNPVSSSNRRLKEKKKKASRRKSLLDFNQTVSSSSDEEEPAAPPSSSTHEEEEPVVKRTTSTTTSSSRRWSNFIDGLTSEEGTDNLDVSCWDKERTDNLDISTYSLPILDNSKGGKLSSLFSRSKSKDGGGGGLNSSTRTGSTMDTSERRGSLDMSERGGGLASSTSTSGGGSIGGHSGGTEGRRRPTNKARTLRQYQKSSRSFLEGVVFPESMEDIHKGLDPRASLVSGSASERSGDKLEKKGLRELSDTYIGSYRELEETVGFVQKNDWRGSRAA